MKKVNHSGNPECKIWVIGENPGETEEEKGIPFVGKSGELLRQALDLAGYPNDTYFGNVCNYRPPGNIYQAGEHRHIAEGVAELDALVLKYKPKVILACGNVPLQALTGKTGIDSYRGSILPVNNDTKLVGTIHPSFILRNPADYPLFSFDIARALNELNIDGLNYLPRNFTLYPQGLELHNWRTKLLSAKFLACDIESTYETSEILCVGFALSPTEGVCLDFKSFEQAELIKEILSSNVKKIFQFGIFDTLMLLNNAIEVHNYTDDTMVAQHILEPELPRSLGFLCSTYTREPYYKGDGRANIPLDTKVTSTARSYNKKELGIYNCKDCCVTYEIHLIQLQELESQPDKLKYYRDEMEMIEVANNISHNGMMVDVELRQKMLDSQLVRWERLQYMFNGLYSYISKVPTVINANSPKVMSRILYKEFGLPEKKNPKTKKPTTNDDALVALITIISSNIFKVKSQEHKTTWGLKLQFVQLLREIRGLRKLVSSYLANDISNDGRVRGTFKIASVETGRWACDMYVDNTGFNLMTFPRSSLEVYDDPKVPNKEELLAMFKIEEEE